ncbi:hypothetical protein BDA96_04G150900 [Sorghum bicolor]|nr:hypothetical protein BDA96_04G150900 [Sorghum bicolor]
MVAAPRQDQRRRPIPSSTPSVTVPSQHQQRRSPSSTPSATVPSQHQQGPSVPPSHRRMVIPSINP